MAINIAQFGHGVRQSYLLDEVGHRQHQMGLRKIELNIIETDIWKNNSLVDKIIECLSHDESEFMPVDMPSNERISAGFTYLGQFITHDITYNRLSTGGLRAYLRLLSLYGGGQDAMPLLYVQKPEELSDETDMLFNDKMDEHFKKFKNIKMVIRRLREDRYDFKRIEDSLAHIGDGRNDQNLLVAQIHIAFLRFHNAVAEYLSLKENHLDKLKLFRNVKRKVIHHYQWIILHQYLKLLVYDPKMVDDLIRDDAEFVLFQSELIPQLMEEFTQAAFRIGHSQVLPRYKINSGNGAISIFAPEGNDLRGFSNKDELDFDWRRMFKMTSDQEIDTQLSGDLDHILAMPLFQLSLNLAPNISLPRLDLERSSPMLTGHSVAGQLYEELMKKGKMFNLMTQKDVLDNLGLVESVLTNGQKDLIPEKLPLWLYILLEAKLLGKGKRLGPLGSHIIAEQLVWTMKNDQDSVLNLDENETAILPEFSNQFFENQGNLTYDFGEYENKPLKQFSMQHLILFPKYMMEWLPAETKRIEIESFAREAALLPSDELESLTSPTSEIMPPIEKYLGTEPMRELSSRVYDAQKNDYAQLSPNLRSATLNSGLYSNATPPGQPNKPIRAFFSYAAINSLLQLPATKVPTDPLVKGILISLGLNITTNPAATTFVLIATPGSEKAKRPTAATLNYAYPSASGSPTDANPTNIPNANADPMIGNFVAHGYPLLIGSTPPVNIQFNPRALYLLLYGSTGMPASLPNVRFDLLLKSDENNHFLTVGIQGLDSSNNVLSIAAPPCPPYCYDES